MSFPVRPVEPDTRGGKGWFRYAEGEDDNDTQVLADSKEPVQHSGGDVGKDPTPTEDPSPVDLEPGAIAQHDVDLVR